MVQHVDLKNQLQLEVPDQVYRRLVKMLIQSVVQEKPLKVANKIAKKG
ncbi:hypothetical protein [Thermanaeromonas sp. C210]|nr:hypothetical protein [Thermanaeromonas sp. C210]GFN21927.1 hypothetical protein TAMC210_02430 [Thermanaeromonas sp. C210]